MLLIFKQISFYYIELTLSNKTDLNNRSYETGFIRNAIMLAFYCM